MPEKSIQTLVARQREFFASGATLDPGFRRQSLRRLREALSAHENAFSAALADDLGKSPGEAYITETGLVLNEISHTLKHLDRWARPRRPPTPLAALPGKSRIYPEPHGLTLNISPWNYPLHLALMPLIPALAAGNCMIVKPSSKAPATAALLERLIAAALPEELAAVAQGDASVAEQLLAERFDFIFYTGSARFGKSVMRAAAEHLTPVCLELGGKSPAIVLADANLESAARRIAWGKAVNAGQTCIAPDYILADASIKDRLVALLKKEFDRFPGPDAAQNPGYARIVSSAALDRLLRLGGGKAIADSATRRMAPLVMPEVGPKAPVMQEEIFGPLLPVLEINSPQEAAAFVNGRGKPLAAYIFSSSHKHVQYLIRQMPFGGGCVNDTLMHMSNPALPFGGAGPSGMGRYHGQYGFELFSNLKGIMHKAPRPDLPLRYPPYSPTTLRWIKKFLR